MVSLTEAKGGRTEFAEDLAQGVRLISQAQEVTFTRYRRVVLPLDGFVFWVRADLINPGAIFNGPGLNSAALGQVSSVEAQAPTVKVQGSLHYDTTNRQNEAEGFSVNRIVFTSLSEISELQAPPRDVLYIGEFDGMRFAFSRRIMLYRQSGLFHYQGDAVYPTMETQLVDDPRLLDLTQVVVSNSLPIWLSVLQGLVPTLPSYLIHDDMDPPYIAVHVTSEGTQGLQAAPWIDPSNGSHYQLARDRIRLTSYGLRNSLALDAQDLILSESLLRETYGIMNIPVWRDDHTTQPELGVLAQKKVMDLEVNYYQQAVRSRGLQYIKSVFIDVLVNPA